MFNRRQFLKESSLWTGLAISSGLLARALAEGSGKATGRELAADVVIIGGGLGGCAAALAAARAGSKVIMTEPTDWIGGQLTQQAVPPDEHPWIEQFGCTRSYRRLRSGVRDYYRQFYPLTAAAAANLRLNPGAGGVSKLCHEPRVSLAVLHAMLAPYISGGRVRVLLEHEPMAAETDEDRIRAVRVGDSRSGDDRVCVAPYFLDATEHGDLLPLAGVEYVTGFESQSQTGEPHAPTEPQPANIQSGTWCFAIDHLPGEDHTIDKPEDYDFWRNYVPELTPPWPGRQLSWSMSHPQTLEVRPVAFEPSGRATSGRLNLWLYRRIAARSNFVDGTYPSDITLVNWPQNDYWLGNLYEVDEAEAARHRRAAKQLSLSLLYWMQTEAPREDGGAGWPGLRLRGDVTGADDGLAKHIYVRESRRIKAQFTVLEQHVGTEARMERTGKLRQEVAAETFGDSVGIGSYRIDLHPSTGADNYLDISSLPFQIPLGALVPERFENLLPACKNLGVTHITNGCYRLHPVEWNIGEAAGALAAFCLAKGEPPRRVRNHKPLLADFQSQLRRDGFELSWPRVTPR